MDLNKTITALKRNGYQVSVFKNKEEAIQYLNQQIDQTSVGIGGSVTLQQLGAYEQLSAHNEVYWHWYETGGMSADDIRRAAAQTKLYLTSVNAISETGEMINIDGTGNRVASTLYGHEKVYFVAGTNKIEPSLAAAIDRARNTASPLNAKRLDCKTPCAVRGDRCYDCRSADRICNAMVIHYRKMNSCEMEVILIEENLGY